MKKKTAHKKNSYKVKQPISYFRIILVASIVLLVIFSGKIYSAFSKQHVLGASTSILLADKGSGDSGDSGSGSSDGNSNSGDSGSGSNSVSGSNSSGSSDNKTTDNSGPENTTSANTNISSNTKVDCIGPDGKHFTTSFSDCQELNHKWGISNFNFTPLATIHEQEKPEPSVIPEQKGNIEQTTRAEVQTEGNKGKLNLQSQGLQIEVKREDNGQLSIHAHQEGGKEVTLKSDALDQINEALKDQEVEVSTTSGNTLAITSHNVAAHTTFPISIDPSTNTLAITTPIGTKDVAILPDKAIQGILHSNILSNVLSQSTTTSSGSATTIIGLTMVNNQPVFEVQGVKEKRLLGLFPVGFQKTVTVSAQTGQVLSTQENPFNQILEALSI